MDSPHSEEFIKIGRVLKTFGIEGDLRCQVGEEYLTLLKKGRFVFVDIDGLKVPFQIRKLEHHHKPLIAFADVDSENQAKALSSCWMFMNPEDYPNHDVQLPQPNELYYSFLSGYTVTVKNSDKVGTIARVEEYPGQEMAFVVFGPDDEVMIPLVENLISSLDQKEKRICFDLPKGMLTLKSN